MYVCVCYAVTEEEVQHKASKSCFTFAHYATTCKKRGCCKCLPRIKEVIDEAIKQKATSKSTTATS